MTKKRKLFFMLTLAMVLISGCGKNEAIQVESEKKESNNIDHRSTAYSMSYYQKNRKKYLEKQIRNANSFIQEDGVRQEKYNKMVESPFNFYRGTSNLFYTDLGTSVISIPNTWKKTKNISTWIEGDAHAQNIGIFNNSKGQMVLGLNDFDETYVAPFYWDLLRFSTSVFLLTDEVSRFNLSSQDKLNLIKTFLNSYQESLKQVEGNNDELAIELKQENIPNGFIKHQMIETKNSNNQVKFLNEWTTVDKGVRKFDFNNSSLTPVSLTRKNSFKKDWKNYVYSKRAFIKANSINYFSIKDIANRIHSGIGSSGFSTFYVLVEGETPSSNDDIILEVKEQQKPAVFFEKSLSASQYNNWFQQQAERSFTGTLAMGVNADKHLGILQYNSLSYFVKQISPWYYSFDANSFHNKSDLEQFLIYSGKAFAYAHAKADEDYDKSYVPYNFEKNALAAISSWPNFNDKIIQLSEKYYDQVKEDYVLFKDLLKYNKLN
ncbi:DUF2252 family protein [Priestia aryabhattai]|uniref:DUF2252 family protein n=1 Tax=Priestia aryabhattai TaxID=412384 RepID=UPI003D2A7E3E